MDACKVIVLRMVSVPWNLFAEAAVSGAACCHACIVASAGAITESATFAAGGDSHAKGITAQFPASSAITSVLTTYLATGARNVLPKSNAGCTRLVPQTISWDEEP